MTETASTSFENLQKRARFWYAYVHQGEWWYPDGRPRITVASMDARYRASAAAWLLRQAGSVEFLYSMAELDILSRPVPYVIGERDGVPVERTDPESNSLPSGDMACDAYDRELEERCEHPEEWLKVTTLYQALTA